MGRQIQILLSDDDEQKLVNHLKGKFPHFQVVNAGYPAGWDRLTLSRVGNSIDLLMIDDRTIEILCRSAHVFGGKTLTPSWEVRSKARSCIDWDRALMGDASRQRLYLNTDGDPIWLDISAATGDGIERMYLSACAWVRANCVNCSPYKHGEWVSHGLEQAYRQNQAEWRARPNLDPRDKRFYELRKKANVRKAHLTDAEIATLISYCNKMIEYVNDEDIAESWRELSRSLEKRRRG